MHIIIACRRAQHNYTTSSSNSRCRSIAFIRHISVTRALPPMPPPPPSPGCIGRSESVPVYRCDSLTPCRQHCTIVLQYLCIWACVCCTYTQHMMKTGYNMYMHTWFKNTHHTHIYNIVSGYVAFGETAFFNARAPVFCAHACTRRVASHRAFLRSANTTSAHKCAAVLSACSHALNDGGDAFFLIKKC